MALILAPIIGLWYVHTMEVGSSSTLSLFGYEIQSVMADRQAKLFGYLFHIAALVAGIYSFHLRDPWQVSMALLYAASAVGVALRATCSPCFFGGRAWPSPRSFKFGEGGPRKPRNPVFAIFSFTFPRACFCWRASFSATTERERMPCLWLP